MCEDTLRRSESRQPTTGAKAVPPTAAQTEAERKERLLAAYEEWYARNVMSPDNAAALPDHAEGGKA